MEIQFILAIILGVVACIFVLRKIYRQLYHHIEDQACDECQTDHK